MFICSALLLQACDVGDFGYCEFVLPYLAGAGLEILYYLLALLVNSCLLHSQQVLLNMVLLLIAHRILKLLLVHS